MGQGLALPAWHFSVQELLWITVKACQCRCRQAERTPFVRQILPLIDVIVGIFRHLANKTPFLLWAACMLGVSLAEYLP